MSSTNKVDTSTEVLHEQRLRELSAQQNTVVYVYGHDDAEGSLPPEDRANALAEIIASFDHGCKVLPHASDEHLREVIMQADVRYRRFQRFYPLVFASVTRRVAGEEAEKKLDRARKLAMLFIIEQWKGEGTDDERHARAMHVALRLSITGNAAEAAENAVSDLPPLEPMELSALGASTVKQK